MDKSAIIKALRDGAQSASNGIASSTIGDGVDGIAYLLRGAGVPVGNAPVGGTDWLKAQGITPNVDDGLPKAVGEGLGQAVGSMMYMPKQLKNVIQQVIK